MSNETVVEKGITKGQSPKRAIYLGNVFKSVKQQHIVPRMNVFSSKDVILKLRLIWQNLKVKI